MGKNKQYNTYYVFSPVYFPPSHCYTICEGLYNIVWSNIFCNELPTDGPQPGYSA